MAVRSIRVKVGERWYTVEVEDLSSSPIKVTVEGETFFVEVEGLPHPSPTPPRSLPPRRPRPGQSQARPPAPKVSEKLIRCPMAGRIVAVNVKPGDTVTPGQEVCIVEAMKMDQSIRTHRQGIIKAVHIRPFQQVGADDPLVELE